MKPLIFALALSIASNFPIVAEQSSPMPNPIKPGMLFADATKILSASGFSGEERHYDMEIPKGTAIRYFPVSRNVDLVVAYTHSSGDITHISLMTSPTNRPVKGLEVYLPIREIVFAHDGSFTASFDAAKQAK